MGRDEDVAAAGEDDLHRAQDQMQKLTDRYIAQIEQHGRGQVNRSERRRAAARAARYRACAHER